MNFIPVIFLACGIIMFVVAFHEPIEGRQSPVPPENHFDTETTPLLIHQRIIDAQEVRQRIIDAQENRQKTNENNDSHTFSSDEAEWDMV